MEHYLKKELYELIKKDDRIFDFIQEASLDGLWYWDLEHPENEWMNPRFWSTLGYQPEKMPHLAKTWQNIINQNDLNTALDNFNKHISDPTHPYDQIVRYTHKNGTIVWVRCRGLAIRNNEGKAIRMLGAHQDITTLKEIEIQYQKEKESLTISEEKHRSLYELAPLAYHSLNEDGYIIDVNPKWIELIQYAKEEVIGKWFGDFMHPDSVEQFKTYFPRFKKQGYVHNAQFKMIRKDGSNIYISLEGCIGYTSEGKFKQTYCTFKDITKEKLAENSLKESEAKFKSLFNHANVGVTLALTTGQLIEVNDYFIRMLGYGKKECLMMNVIDLTYPEDLENEKQLIKQIEEGKMDNYRLEKRMKHKNGNLLWIDASVSAYKDIQGRVEMYLTMLLDITDSKKAERELNKSTIILNNTNDAIITTDADGYIEFWNKGAQLIYHYTQEEVLGKQVAVIFKDKDYAILDALLPKLFSEHSIENIEITSIDKNNKEIDILLSLNTVLDENGNVREVVGVIKDITDRKLAEQRLLYKNNEYEALNEELTQINEELYEAKERAEEANKLKTEFLHNMSHEIRTPMNGIMGFSDMLSDKQLSEQKKGQYISIIQNSSTQLLRIIDDILEISTLETKQLKLYEETICLNDFIMELFSVYDLKSKERNIHFYLKKGLSDQKSQLITDKSKLQKILSNLLDNAIKYTQEGFIELGYYLEDSKLIIYVKDSGIGISTANQNKIFERFSQESKDIAYIHGGLGLGLSISKENAQLLGGDIILKSEKGKGSTFSVHLPFKPAYSTHAVAKHSEEIAKDTYKILIAEDEEINYLYLETILQQIPEMKINLIHAKNGRQAIDICMSDNTIQLVLMDIKMPLVNGYEATEKIKETYPNLPIIIQTAYSIEADKKMGFKHGCDYFISKPINKNQLIKLITKIFKQ